MSEPVIRARDLVKRYGSFVAVDAIRFDIAPGECFGFLGPNGAGKSSTMRMIYGASPVDGGELRVLDMDARRRMRAIKYRLGVIPQEDNLDPDLRVEQNLLVYARYFDIPKREAKARARDALELFQLWDKRRAFIRELSGGMKRRLVIARALVNQPEVLIADEPTTGLDPQARHLVWQKLRQLQSRGVTVVLTTHYMEEAAQLCDRLAIMDRARILDTGAPRALVGRHVPPEVFEFALDDAVKGRVHDALRSIPAETEEVGDALYVYTKDGSALRERLDHLDGLQRVLQRPASLEDVFLKLTGRALEE